MSESVADDEAALIALLCAEGTLSTAKACKRLGLSMSELLRLLVVLGPAHELGGLGLVERATQGGRELLQLSQRGQALCRSR